MTTRRILQNLKAETGIDYTHADAQTQEEQAGMYLDYVAKRQAAMQPKPKTEEQMADEHDQHVVDVYNRYRSSGWTLPKEYAGIEWDRLLSVQEAAGMLGVNRQRVHQLIDSQKLEGAKIGGTWIIDRASVEARIASR